MFRTRAEPSGCTSRTAEHGAPGRRESDVPDRFQRSHDLRRACLLGGRGNTALRDEPEHPQSGFAGSGGSRVVGSSEPRTKRGFPPSAASLGSLFRQPFYKIYVAVQKIVVRQSAGLLPTDFFEDQIHRLAAKFSHPEKNQLDRTASRVNILVPRDLFADLGGKGAVLPAIPAPARIANPSSGSTFPPGNSHFPP